MEIKDLYEIFLSCGTITTDSRTIKGGELFVALKGENFDGNAFVLKALEAGAAYAVADATSAAGKSSNPKIIPVEDTLKTLQDLARYHREKTLVDGKPIKVIGLTGTNGKTTTKNLITKVLSKKYKVTATEGNLNNDIGVPLSLLKINKDTELAVIEMGANHPDDIQKLVKVCEPNYGLITNVGKAHLLGFGSFEGVQKAKGALYDYLAENDGLAFVNADDPILMSMAAKREGMKTILYGCEHDGVIVLPMDEKHPYMRMAVPDSNEYLLGLESKLVGDYNANNAMAAIAIGKYFGVSVQDAVSAIEEYVPDNNRSQMEVTENNTLIVDAYNANPTSMAAALSNFGSMHSDKKIAMLGEMRELGQDSVKEHIDIVRKAEALDLDQIFLVGEEFDKAITNIGQRPNVLLFKTSDDLVSWLGEHKISDTTILIKGSHSTQMEKVVNKL